VWLKPVEPDLPGLQDFSGEIVMSRSYRDGSPHAGKDVLVVGSGNTGTELAVDLVEHGAARVRLAVRTIPHILRRSAGPYAAQYTGITVRHLPAALVDRAAALVERATTPDLTAYGLPRPTTGLLTRVERDNAIPVQDVGIIDAIRAGRVEPVAALASFEGDAVVLSDGSRLEPDVVVLATGYAQVPDERLEPDVVVLATGYAQGLEPLIGHLGLLDGLGHPVTRAGATPRGARGLWFNGFTNPISGMLREIAIDSKKIALAMALTKRRRLAELTSAPTA